MSVFSTILKQAADRGIAANQSQSARRWFRDQATSATTSAASLLKTQGVRSSGNISFGDMVLFRYEPKHADTLPFYDRYPLIFPVDSAPGGFYGINLHYLPLQLRAKLMDGLYSLVTDQNYDENTKINLSYKMLRSASQLRYFKPCFKHYLNSYVRSNFRIINANEWDIALFLPLERFAKASSGTVHAYSVKRI